MLLGRNAAAYRMNKGKAESRVNNYNFG